MMLQRDNHSRQRVREYLKKNILPTPDLLQKPPSTSNDGTTIHPTVRVVTSYEDRMEKLSVNDFVSYFNKRYHDIRKKLQVRQELQNLTSIRRIKERKESEHSAIVCMIREKRTTKNNNTLLTVEDNTGEINVLLNKNNREVAGMAGELVPDDIIGVVGKNGDNIFFANKVVFPDTLPRDMKKAPDEVYALFLSDLHIGSRFFLRQEFNKFIEWLKGKTGSSAQQRIAERVRYLFIVGDIVDGCGIYPEQQKELEIDDITQQYEESARLLSQVPPHIRIVICPGNHDAMHVAEPQPTLYKDFAASLWELPNVVMVSNPSTVTIHSSSDFPGFDVLLYHGYSFDYYAANVDTIRNQGGYDRADLIMKFLLQRRHLAPTYGSTLYLPRPDADPLVISHTPDFFVTGHIHKTAATNYHGTTLLCGSCWQRTTPFQKKVGHHPEPCRVPIVNLKTRDIKILKF